MKLLISTLITIAAFSAQAQEVVASSLITAYSSSNCTNAVGIAPVGSPYVNCDAIPNGNSYIYSIKAVGGDCVQLSSSTTFPELCKAYNRR